MRFIRRFEETLLALFDEGAAQRHHARLHRPGSRRGRRDRAPRRGRPRVLQPPLPRPLPRPDRRRAGPARRDHGQGARASAAASAAASTSARRASSPTASRAASCPPPPGSRSRCSCDGTDDRQRGLHRRRHARRGRRLRDAQHRVAVAAAAARRRSRTTGGRRARRSSVNLAGSMRRALRRLRAAGRGVDSTDVAGDRRRRRARRSRACPRARRPAACSSIHTYRLCHHSKSDDNRPAEEVAARWALEPLAIHGRRHRATASASASTPRSKPALARGRRARRGLP